MILDFLREGLNVSDSCGLAGISRDSYYRWLKEDEEFAKETIEAELSFKRDLLKTVKQASLRTWQAACWLLERKWQPEFSIPVSSEREVKQELADLRRLLTDLKNKK